MWEKLLLSVSITLLVLAAQQETKWLSRNRRTILTKWASSVTISYYLEETITEEMP